MTPQFDSRTLEAMVIALVTARDKSGDRVHLNFEDVFCEDVVKQLKEKMKNDHPLNS